MTNAEAIAYLENEVLCAQTRAAGCDGKCNSCDIKKPDRERFIAYGKAINALKAQMEDYQWRATDDGVLYSVNPK